MIERTGASQPLRPSGGPASHPPSALRWVGGAEGHLEIVEQTLLPAEFRSVALSGLEEVRDAIRRLAIRGAPAIGVGAAFALHLEARRLGGEDATALLAGLAVAGQHLVDARPTAVNLSWAVERVLARARRESGAAAIRAAVFEEARAIAAEDSACCEALGRHGAALVPAEARLLTHCNAGALATAGMGTALAVMFEAKAQGKRLHVYVDETRPLLQGARLTAWELQAAGIPVTLICDGMAAHVMATRGVDQVFVGADRIAANGDTANKIGTYALALAARAHGVPFYVVAPLSTFDPSLPDGSAIPIEERDPEEVTGLPGRRTAPLGVDAWNPAFDVTPAALITGIVTERGVVAPVTRAAIAGILRG
jgi:methylthioribose-1-phosphate isomerase